MTTDWTDWFKAWDAFPAAPSNPWNAGLDQWWRSFQRDRYDRPSEVMERVVSQGKSFFELCQQLAAAGGQAQGVGDWQQTVDETLERMKEAFASTAAAPATGFWQLPMENWQRAVSAMSGMPADYLGSFPGGEADSWRNEVQDRLGRFLGMPGVGYTRELQEQYQTLLRLVMEYQQTLERYSAANAEMARLSLDRLQDRLRARGAEKGEPVSSARELYNLWVECSEEVYGEYVRKEDYAVVHGDLVNALMAVKNQSGKIMDEIAGMFNMPTRSEMDTVHSRFQHSRRAAAQLRVELDSMREQLGAAGAGLVEDQAAMKAAQKELHARLSDSEQLLGELRQRIEEAFSGASAKAPSKGGKGKKGKKPKKAKKGASKAKKKDD